MSNPVPSPALWNCWPQRVGDPPETPDFTQIGRSEFGLFQGFCCAKTLDAAFAAGRAASKYKKKEHPYVKRQTPYPLRLYGTAGPSGSVTRWGPRILLK